jgi:hypothetical protein
MLSRRQTWVTHKLAPVSIAVVVALLLAGPRRLEAQQNPKSGSPQKDGAASSSQNLPPKAASAKPSAKKSPGHQHNQNDTTADNDRTTGFPLPLGALSGNDADSLAGTLTSVFGDQYVVTASADPGCKQKPSDDDSPMVTTPSQSNSSKNTLCVKQRDGTVPSKSHLAASDFSAVVASLDRDSFKGGVLNSNYVVKIGDPDFARRLITAFPHPAPDIDLTWPDIDPRRTANYCIILVPSTALTGQSTAGSTLAKDAAGLKHDLLALYQYASGETESTVSCAGTLDLNGAERCLASNTIMLSTLDPRDVAIHAAGLLSFPVSMDVFPLNHSIAFLPQDSKAQVNANPEARVIEQYELFFQDQKQQQLAASLQPSSGASSSASGNSGSTTVTSTTTSTTKTSVAAANSVQSQSLNRDGQRPSAGNTSTNGSSKETLGPATTITTKTSTSVQPPASSGSSGPGLSSGGGGAGSGSGAGSSGSMGGASSGGTGGTLGSAASGTAGGGSGGGAAGGSVTTAQAQPTAPNWGIDDVVRLYDYRDAQGIAAAINGMVSYVPNSRPIVQPLSDFGANDMIEILPSAAQQGGYKLGDVERAIALFDLPRPQLSLQIWSYQISSRAKNFNKPYKESYDGPDDARQAMQAVDDAVAITNRDMIRALQEGMAEVFKEAAASRPICAAESTDGNKPCSDRHSGDPFFDEDFREYLTLKNYECINEDRYCLGYFDALDFPADSGNRAVNASLSQMILFIAATRIEKRDNSDEDVAGLVKNLIQIMRKAMGHTDADCVKAIGGWNDAEKDKQPTGVRPIKRASSLAGCFMNFQTELDAVVQPGNLETLRRGILDFLFNYKWSQNYPNDFVPYDLRRSAHALDDLLQPVDDAFDQDVDDIVETRMDAPSLVAHSHKAGLVSQGMVHVATLSGRPANVSGEVSNYFNISQTPSLSQVAQTLLGAGGGAGGGSSSNGSGGSTGGGGAGSGGGNGGGGNSGGLLSAISTLSGSNPYAIGGAALANILSPQPITAQLTRGITLIVTPTSLDTASSAELNVSLLVNEPDGGPQSVNTTAATLDTLDRVANHSVTDTVRVQSLRLFDLSTLVMQITHPLPRTCVPTADDQPWHTLSYFPAIPFSVPCAVWRSVFGSVPMAGRLFEWPQTPVTVDNRSIAIIRAVVVPTAMDLGEGMNYASDRIEDPLTNTDETLFSMQQLGFRFRRFHLELMRCMVDRSLPICQSGPRLSKLAEDIRKPTTN